MQLTTDSLKSDLSAVETAFGADTDYAMLHKHYDSISGERNERRYSPAVCTGIEIKPVTGNPDLAKASTSYVERQDLTTRMGVRRFARLTNGFSKKVENLAHAVSLHYMHYNFARPHKTLTKVANGYPPRRQWPLASPTAYGHWLRSPPCWIKGAMPRPRELCHDWGHDN